MNKAPLNIAVVDDEKDFLKIFEVFFRKEVAQGEFKLFYFNNGKECSDFLNAQKNSPKLDMVLTDLNMPVMNGFDLLKVCREKDPSLPVFVISAYGSSDRQSMAKSLGAKEYFVKPLNFGEIKLKVREYLKDASPGL